MCDEGKPSKCGGEGGGPTSPLSLTSPGACPVRDLGLATEARPIEAVLVMNDPVSVNDPISVKYFEVESLHVAT